MDERRLDRLRAIVLAAASRPPGERADLVARECGDDRSLHDAAMELLALDAGAVAGVDRLAREGLDRWFPDAVDDDLATGQLAFDRYRLREEIGRGGSSTVYRAEQTAPVAREVALKVLRSRRLDPVSRDRFLAEQQVLAMLEHPNVARVFDAGTTPAGRPYFALELVRGTSLTRHCDGRGLDRTARLRLFLQACWGVEHAHRKGVLHRDLKPSNLLVAEQEGHAVVKVIDFGIARPLESREDPQWTIAGHMLGTPQYMSPEQARDERRLVDVRSDVFSLGVVLHELLTGTIPYDTETDSALAMLGAVSRGEVAVRGDDPRGRRLPRDLVAIVRRATHVDPEQRYESPAALARDLENHLHARPVAARRGGTWYQLTRLAARHPLGTGLAAALLVVILAATATVTVLYQRAEREAERARLEATTATSLADYLRGMFVDAAPSGGDPHVTIPEVLDGAAARAEQDLADQPLVLAKVLDTIGGVKADLGEEEPAHEIWRIAHHALAGFDQRGVEPLRTQLALKIALSLPARAARRGAVLDVLATLPALDVPDHARADIAYSAHFRLAEMAGDQQDLATSIDHLERASAALERVESPDEGRRIQLLFLRGKALWQVGENAEARALMTEALAGYEHHLGREDARTLAVLSTLAVIESALGEHASAMARQKLLIDRAAAVLGPDHVALAGFHNNYGMSLVAAGRLAEALEHLTRAFDLWEARLPADHPHHSNRHANVGYGLLSAGQYDRARERFDAAIAHEESLAAPRLLQLAGYHQLRGVAEQRLGRLQSAAADLDRAAALIAEVGHERHASSLMMHVNRASLELDRGRVDAAREAIDIARDIVASGEVTDTRQLLITRSVRARVDHARGETDRARTAFGELEDRLLGDRAVPAARRHEISCIAAILEQDGDRAAATRWRAALDEMETHWQVAGR
ncbi:protein kinase [bacterium]|nr:protein kinase [bacterium]